MSTQVDKPTVNGKKRARAAAPAQPQAEIRSTSLGEDDMQAALRQKRVADAAYYRAEKRGFAPGYELEDWLAAEAEVAQLELLATTVRSDGGSWS